MIDDRRLQRLARLQRRELLGELMLAQLQLGEVAPEGDHRAHCAADRRVRQQVLLRVAPALRRVVDPAFPADRFAAEQPLGHRHVALENFVAEQLGNMATERLLGAQAEELQELVVDVEIAVVGAENDDATGDVVEQRAQHHRVGGSDIGELAVDPLHREAPACAGTKT